MMIERIHWIDLLKGLGIFFVILGHTIKNNDLYVWIYSFHMPLFFFISGYLTEPRNSIKDYNQYIWKKCKNLLFPFFIFRILLVFYWLIVEQYFRPLDLGPIWFLIVLFGVEILIAHILLKWKQIKIYLVVFVGCIISFYMFKAIDTNISFLQKIFGWLARFANGGLWFCLAFIIRKIERKISCSYQYNFIILIFAAISIFCCKYNGDVSIYSNRINNIILYLIFGLSGIGMISFLCKHIIKKHYWIEWIGNYTIIILAVHEPIKRIILKLISIFFNEDIYIIQSNIFMALFIAFVVLLLCIPVIYLFKYLKKHLGKIGTLLLNFVR